MPLFFLQEIIFKIEKNRHLSWYFSYALITTLSCTNPLGRDPNDSNHMIKKVCVCVGGYDSQLSSFTPNPTPTHATPLLAREPHTDIRKSVELLISEKRMTDIGNIGKSAIIENFEFPFSVNHFPISVNYFELPISVNHFPYQ